jgi:hypothetical protein
MRQHRGLKSLRLSPIRDREADAGVYTWIEPKRPDPLEILSSALTGMAYVNQQIRALRESYPMVEARCREAVSQRLMTAADAARMLGDLLAVRDMLERTAVTEGAVKRRKKAAA